MSPPTFTRPRALLLVWLVAALHSGPANALQVGARRRKALSRAREPTARFSPTTTSAAAVPHQTRHSDYLSELTAFANSEEFEYSSRCNASRRQIALLRWSALALVLAVTSKSLIPSLLGLVQSYSQYMTTKPLATNIVTGAVLATAGDAMAQAGTSSRYDARRAASFAAFDACFRVFQAAAFPLIIRNCRGRVLRSALSVVPGLALKATPGLTQFLAVCERVLTFQLAVVPLLYYPVFFTFTGLMQGLSLEQTFQRAKANFLPCWRVNLLFWVPAQFVMFGLIPEKWHIAFTSVMGIIWSLILSAVAGKAKVD